jgi:hypothetical protein
MLLVLVTCCSTWDTLSSGRQLLVDQASCLRRELACLHACRQA